MSEWEPTGDRQRTQTRPQKRRRPPGSTPGGHLTMSDDDDPRSSRTRTTLELDPMDVHSWPIVLAGLERLGTWDPVFTLRLGMLQRIRGVLVRMCERDATADLVNELREVVEALAKMPWAPLPDEPR